MLIQRICALLCLFALALTAGIAHAQDTPEGIRVGVIIKGPGGAESRYCVTLPPDKSTGLDALRATNVDLNVQAGPLGAAVCRLQNVGCTYPAEPCFCQCQGAVCRYWSYFYHNAEGKWQYSSIGLSGRKLTTGDVEGWLWSEGTSQTPTSALPDVTFAALCDNPQAAGAARPADSPTPLAIAGYVVFGALLIGIGGMVIWRRRRAR